MCVCVAARWGGACFKNEITQAVGVAIVGCVYVRLPGVGGLALRMRLLRLSVFVRESTQFLHAVQ